MYRLVKVEAEEIVRELERTERDVFGHRKSTNPSRKGYFSEDIKSGQVLAFQCLNDNEVIGGMLLGNSDGAIMIHRCFVEEKEMGKGAGTFMMQYVTDHKDFFDEYYGQKTTGIVIEPINGRKENESRAVPQRPLLDGRTHK